jgi:hypothetical protein
MSFDNDGTLRGYEIVTYNMEEGITDTNVAYRLFIESYDSDVRFEEVWERFVADPLVGELKAVSIGYWGSEDMDDDPCDNLPELLIAAASGPLKDVEALFVGDISGEECEVSWITQFELGGVVSAFKKLKYFKARGGNDLGLTGMDNPTLEVLIVETGGLGGDVVRAIAAAKLPNLQHLELWTGSRNYGASVGIDDVMPLLVGTAYPEMKYPFPKLKYLGIRNSEIADEIAEALLTAPVLDIVQQIDLSKGLLSDRGAKALAENTRLGADKMIDITNNYVADVELIDQISATGATIVNGGQRSAEEDYWYVEVGE